MKKEKDGITTEEGNYLTGIVGAIIGGMLATLPWILMYVYGNMMWSMLGLLIGLGAFKGYEICKGKMDKKVPYIIGIVSILAITVATLYIIPQLLIIQEYGSTSLEMLKTLYAFDEFKSAIIQDYIYSLLFTILGISGIIASVKRSIENGDAKIQWNAPAFAPKDEEIEELRNIFKERNALDKDHTIPKSELMDKIKGQENVLKFLTARGIVQCKKGAYYYNLDNEEHPGKRTLKIMGITFAIMAAIIILIVLFV